ncbi:MAG: hypothetical protein AAFQ98_17825 [Bacteroidota bacterium]
MKLPILFASLIALSTTQCISPTSPQVVGDSGITYRESREIWRQLKEENGETYRYAFRVSSWSGYSYTTEIGVQEGEVVFRNYEVFQEDFENQTREIIDSYEETGAEIGTHEEGAEPLSLDELYHDCRDIYLTTNSIDNELYFDTDVVGVMSTCGYVPNGCQDDCFQGITIEFLGWGIEE